MRFHGSRRPTLIRDEPRVAMAAQVESPAGPITIANTHLSFIRWWNRRQLRHLVRSLAPARRPLVLMGDLNMGPGLATSVTGMRALALRPTFPADEPREQIDHVLADGAVRAQAFEVRRLPLSDHRALIVDLALGSAC
jgi:endonuclease/exonuclease/phosphatase family metal-dependent hydrolase